MNNSMVDSNNNSNSNSRSTRGGADELETFVMENCMMLFKSQAAAAAAAATTSTTSNDIGRTYACKTCGKKFQSFQALGGHRASHKKPKILDTSSADVSTQVKPKSHACSICGVEFPIGQALGGHMRRHRAVISTLTGGGSTVTTTTEVSDGNNDIKKEVVKTEMKRKNDDVLDESLRPWLTKMSGNKRVCLDFNLSLATCVAKKEESHGDGEIEDEEDFLKLELRQPIRS